MLYMSQVGIYVSDQDAALRFYTEKLGFEIRALQEAADFKWIEVAPPGGQTTIVLATPDFPIGDTDKVGIVTSISFETDDIRAVHRTYTQRGVEFTNAPRLEPYGKWFASFCDQDGNEFFLFQSA